MAASDEARENEVREQMNEMNRLIRRTAGREPDADATRVPVGQVSVGTYEINNEIRRAAGYPGAPPLPAPAPDESLRALIAKRAGLPADWGERLRGDSPAELAEDAARLARVMNRTWRQPARGFDGGARATPPRPPSFESQLRAQVEDRRDAIRHRAIDLDRIP